MTIPSEQFETLNSLFGTLRLPYVPHHPTAKQELFLLQDALEVFFGGAAGPGKSWALLMAALQYVDHPGYHAILLRPALTEFEQPTGLIEVSRDWLAGSDAFWNGTLRRWTFPSGATLRFGYLRTPSDVARYKGAAASFVGFDELTSFATEAIYRSMFRLLRQPSEGLEDVPVRIRSASNPGGIGHCVPYGDVLTPTGWRPIEDMRVGDAVYAVDPAGGLVSSTVEQVHRHVAAEIVEVNTRSLHMAVTPEHRVAKVGGTRRERGGRFSLVPFSDLPGQTTILRSVSWHCEPLAAVAAPRPSHLRATRRPQPGVLSPTQYARLLGWFLTEGNLVDRDRAFAIAQSKPKTREKLRAFLEDDCGFAVSWSASGATVYAAGWYEHLHAVAPGRSREKAVPRAILNAPPEVLAAFLDAALDGDGHRSGTGGEFYTTSARLADDVAEAAVKLGYVVYASSRVRPGREGYAYCVSLRRRLSGGTEVLTGQHVYDVETKTGRRSDVQRHTGPVPVYCIGLPEHHAFVLRQRGSVWVSGNSWVKTRFVDPASRPRGSVYLPAKMRDNPYLNVEQYLRSLSHMDPIDRQRLIDGDWDVTEEGEKFRREFFLVIERDEQPPAKRSVRYWDLAATEPSEKNPDPDFTVGLRLDLDADGFFTISDIVRGRWPSHKVEEVVRQTAEVDGRSVWTYIEQEPGASGKALVEYYKRVVLRGFACAAGLPRGGDKEVRARPAAAAAANGLIRVVRGRNVIEFLDEVSMFPTEGYHDDCVDALSGAHSKVSQTASGEYRSSTAADVMLPSVLDRVRAADVPR